MTGPVEKPSEAPNEVDLEASFPVFEDRAIREDPLEMRRTYPAQFMGLLARIDCQTRTRSAEQFAADAPLPTTITTGADDGDGASAAALVTSMSQDDSKVLTISNDGSTIFDASKDPAEEIGPDDVVDVIMVTNDLGIDQMNVIMDCECWCRTLRFLLNEHGGGFDGRWNSGNWTEQLTPEMLVHPSAPLELEDHLQPLKLFYLDEHEFISSDLFHVNARITINGLFFRHVAVLGLRLNDPHEFFDHLRIIIQCQHQRVWNICGDAQEL